MYKKYFAEYDISEKDLRANILSKVKELNSFAPEEFSDELIERISSENSTENFLKHLLVRTLDIEKLEKDFSLSSTNSWLKVIVINLDIVLHTKKIELFLPKLIHLMFASEFLGFRYAIAASLIETDLKENLRYDPDKILSSLLDIENIQTQSGGKFAAAMLVEKEIASAK